MGRVADGASGMSSGFCCAAAALTRHNASPNVSPSLIAALIFVAIPKPSSFLFLQMPSWPAHRGFLPFYTIEMPGCARLVHLTVTGHYRID